MAYTKSKARSGPVAVRCSACGKRDHAYTDRHLDALRRASHLPLKDGRPDHDAGACPGTWVEVER